MMINQEESLPLRCSLVYEIEESVVDIEDEAIKVYGLRVTQSHRGVIYTSMIKDITSKRDRIEAFRKMLMEKSVGYDGLLSEVERFIANDLCIDN